LTSTRESCKKILTTATEKDDKMIYVVYIPKSEVVKRDTVLGAFLMMYDAETFLKGSLLSTLRIKEVDDWTSWSGIRKTAFGEREE